MKRYGAVLLGLVIGCEDLIGLGSRNPKKAAGLPEDRGQPIATADQCGFRKF